MIIRIEWFDPTLIQSDKKSTPAGMVKYVAYGEIEKFKDRYIVYCAYPAAEIGGYEVTGKSIGFIVPKGPGVKITQLEVVSDAKGNVAGGKRQSKVSKEVGNKR